MSNGLPINSAELLRARARKGWTLRQVTERCKELDPDTKVDHGNLARYEKGLIRPTPRVLLALATALDVTTDSLLLVGSSNPDGRAA